MTGEKIEEGARYEVVLETFFYVGNGIDRFGLTRFSAGFDHSNGRRKAVIFLRFFFLFLLTFLTPALKSIIMNLFSL